MDRDERTAPPLALNFKYRRGSFRTRDPCSNPIKIRPSSLPGPMTECPVLEQSFSRFIVALSTSCKWRSACNAERGTHYMARRTLNLATLFIAATALAYAGHHPKIAPDLEGRDPGAQVDVIIQYKQGAQQKHVDAVSR